MERDMDKVEEEKEEICMEEGEMEEDK